jgi:hypothetical protein
MDRVVRINDDSNERDKTGYIDQSSSTHCGTTVVIDDRLQVLARFVEKKVRHLFLFRPQEAEVEKYRHTGALDHVVVVQAWAEIMAVLKAKNIIK